LTGSKLVWCEGRARLLALGGESARPRRRFRRAPVAPGIGPAKAGQILDQTGGTGAVAAPAELRAPGGDRAEWSAFTDMTRSLSLRLADWPAEIEAVRPWYEPHLVVPQRFYVHQQSRGVDSHLCASRTRFLPDTLLGLFEQRTWLMRAAEPGRAVAGRPEARVDIVARLRAQWR
jgi:hypothetical protein